MTQTSRQPAHPDSEAMPAPGPDKKPRVVFVQEGARLHYVIPLILQQMGCLEAMYTDWYIRRNRMDRLLVGLLGLVDAHAARRMSGRRHSELDANRITQNRWLKVSARARRYCQPRPQRHHLLQQQHTRWLRRCGLGHANVLAGFIRHLPPEFCRHAREQGLKVMADQVIAPARVEQAEAATQADRWPQWATQEGIDYDRIAEREEATWPELDHITCASHYVKDGLLRQGVEPTRVSVLPYPIEVTHYPMPARPRHPKPVTVGFVGRVGLRKGAPYFFEVARRFDPHRVRFVMVGPVNLRQPVLQTHRGSVDLVGAVSRGEVIDWLKTFDLFFFPSTCEGSAGALMEAMATGLPVVTTPNSGTVARDGEEGFIRHYDDIDGLTDCIEQLVRDPDRRAAMAAAARRKAEQCNIHGYGAYLLNLIKCIVTQ